MRKLNILKTLLDFAFFTAVLTALGLLIFIPILFLEGEDMVPIKINNIEIKEFDLFTKLLLLAGAIGAMVFLYSIYLLRKAVTLFRQRDLFSSEIIRCFGLIGKCLIASALLVNVPAYVYNAVKRNHIGISFNIGYDSLLLSLSLGLFFMVLAEVFKIAKNLKEENELTV